MISKFGNRAWIMLGSRNFPGMTSTWVYRKKHVFVFLYSQGRAYDEQNMGFSCKEPQKMQKLVEYSKIVTDVKILSIYLPLPFETDSTHVGHLEHLYEYLSLHKHNCPNLDILCIIIAVPAISDSFIGLLDL